MIKIAVIGAASAGLAALVSACSTATPVVLESGKLPGLQGRVNTTAGYTGTITTDGQACRGSFTGQIGQNAVPLEVSCLDGRRGVGVAAIADGYFVSGDVRLSDGSRLTIRPSGPAFP